MEYHRTSTTLNSKPPSDKRSRSDMTVTQKSSSSSADKNSKPAGSKKSQSDEIAQQESSSCSADQNCDKSADSELQQPPGSVVTKLTPQQEYEELCRANQQRPMSSATSPVQTKE